MPPTCYVHNRGIFPSDGWSTGLNAVEPLAGAEPGGWVFISFSSKDLAAAEQIREAIERRGYGCWMSSRDILSGENFQEAIMRALRRAAAVVLIFSSNANASSEIKKEVALASTYGIPLIPARLENILPTDALAYEFITRQWIDLFPDQDAAVRRLCTHLEALGRGGTDDGALGPGFTAPLSLAETPNNLPAHATQFIGREDEKLRLAELVSKHRLVTLLGTGGLGKTRLSLEVAQSLKRKFPDGVWLAELAPLSEPQLVAETIAGILSLEVPSSRKATDVVVAFLRDKTLLLVLDNCEHLIGAAAAFAQALVRGCPQVTLIASSREPLGIPDEHAFRMPTLAAPAADATELTAEEAMTYSSVELFVARARAALGSFELSDEDATTVGTICRRLDGIALAIELAAPRLKMLRPAQLLEKLDERFRILTGGSRTALPRQQTLRALIDWSFNLLSESEQAMLRRLSVFPGGCTLEAAAEVCVGDPVEDWEIFDLMASLNDKSLVQTEHMAGETRYRLLESTRAYGREKLKEAGEGDWPRKLAAYMARLMKAADWEYETTPSPEWRDRYGPEVDNLRAALDFSFAPGGDVDSGLAMVAYSGWLWTEMDLSSERGRRVEIAFSRIGPDTDPAVAARIYYKRGAGVGAGLSSDGSDDVSLAVDLARRSGEPLTLARALIERSLTAMGASDFDRADAVLDEALGIAQMLGRTKVAGTVQVCLGMSRHYRNETVQARHYYQEALAIFRSTNDPRGANGAYLNLAELLFAEGEIESAIAEAKRGLSIAEAHHLRASQALLCANLTAYLVLLGDYDAGCRFARRAMKQARDLDHDMVCAWAIQHVAAVAIAGSHFETAAMLQGFVDAIYSINAAEPEPTERLSRDRVQKLLADVPDVAAIARLSLEGGRLSLDDAIGFATRFIDDGAAMAH